MKIQPLVYVALGLTLAFHPVAAQQKLFDTTASKPILKHQVLLINNAVFKGHKDELYGASAFLINYRDKIYAVTAKHLLGEAKTGCFH